MIGRSKRLGLVTLLFSGLMIHLLAFSAWAGEEGGNWRGTYDEVMLWVNFAILVFVVVKFGKEPIMNFLRSQKDELSLEIKEIEDEKKAVELKIQETHKALADSDAHFADLKERIINQGERKRQEIIKEAEQQSIMMMDIAKQKIGSRIINAKRSFRDELIDSAFDMAEKQLPQQVTEEDNQKMVDLYLANASSK